MTDHSFRFGADGDSTLPVLWGDGERVSWDEQGLITEWNARAQTKFGWVSVAIAFISICVIYVPATRLRPPVHREGWA